MTPNADRPELTNATATPQQVAEAGREARRKLAAADARRTPEQRQAAQDLLGITHPAA